MSVDLSRFQESFFEEAAEHLVAIEDGLLQLEQCPHDLDLLNRIFRAAHSIKGNSGMFGFAAIGAFTHKMETLLDRLRSGQTEATDKIADLLLRSTDCLRGLIEAAQRGSAVNESAIGTLTQELEEYEGSGHPSGVQMQSTREQDTPRGALLHRYLIHWTPPTWLFQRGLDPIRMIKGLMEVGTIVSHSMDLGRLPLLTDLDPESCYLSWTFQLETMKELPVVESVFEFVREDSLLTITEDMQGLKHRQAVSSHEHLSKPIGAILVDSGVISPQALGQALAAQKRLGEVLVEQKAATPQQIAQALKTQKETDAAAPGRKGSDAASIRVDTGKIDKLINLVGELVITQSMLSALGAKFEMNQLPVLLERVAQLERNTREIQERVMGIRMLPIGQVFNRFPRLVRDLSAKNGKRIQLVTSGEDTEVDKTVIESIGDPLTHLVRNSADHGLEPPEERQEAGKPEQGIIRLNAFHEGGNICITVEDDGRGLNKEKIRAKAVAKRLIDEADKLSDEQIWGMIFRPGFSTADTITDISGRGVGMDVVKRNIEALGGSVTIRTAAQRGTTFSLKLPLTLAIIEGMTVRVGSELYIIPLVSIVESIQPKDCEARSVMGQGEMVSVRGIFHPVVRLYQAFGMEAEYTDLDKAILVIVESEGERVALMVDELVGQQQVVIKSLEKNFRKVSGIAGATILGDGTVGFILDVRSLLGLARQQDVIRA